MSRTGTWVWDVYRAAPVYWSPEMCRLYGRDPSHGPPSSEECRAVHRPEDWSSWIAAVQECVASRTEIQLDLRLMLADSSFRRLRINGRPIAADGIQVTEIIGSASDLSDSGDESSDHPEDRFRQMIDLIPAPAWSSGPDGSVDFLNQSWLDYTGLTMDEARDWGWMVTFHPDDVGSLVEYWKALLAAGEPGAIEARLRRFDGQYRWCHVLAKPLRDKSGKVCRWYGSNTDVEDRRRAEDALRESERELRLMVDSIPGMIATADSKGQHDYANKRALDYTGTAVQASGRLGFIETIHPDEQEVVKNEWLRCAQSSEATVFKHRWRRFDGAFRWFDVRVEPLLDNQGRIVRLYGLLTDIDDQRRAEEEVRRSEQHLRLLVETIPALVWRSGPDGKFEYVNQRLTGYLGEDLDRIGFNVVHPDDRDRYRNKFADALQTGKAWEDTCRLRRFDGQYRWFHVRVEPLRDHDGRLIHWYAVNVDIHEGKELEETLRLTRNRLVSAMQIATVAELSASIAHEINQPLASIAANGQACMTWLAADPPNLARARLTSERMIRDTNAAADVVRRIRALFKQTAPAKAPADVNAIFGEVLSLMAEEIRYTRITVDTDLAAGLPLVVVDRVQIQQCLINLLRNAIEAKEKVEGRRKVLSIASRRDGGGVLIEIRDTGCGVENPASIFDAFFTTKDSGMGMGLAICRSIIDAHNGRLWATQHEGSGMTFSLTLPLQADGAT